MLWYQQNYRIHGEKKTTKRFHFQERKNYKRLLTDIERERNGVSTDRNRKWDGKLESVWILLIVENWKLKTENLLLKIL